MAHAQQSVSSHFRPPDFTSDLPVDDYYRKVPKGAAIRGLFLEQVTDFLRRREHDTSTCSKYSPYLHYPLRDYYDHILKAGQTCFPNMPVREQLRRIGAEVYPYFENTMPGKAIFAFAGNDFRRVSGMGAKAYNVALSGGSCETVVSDRKVVAKLRLIWNFNSCLQIGVWQGAMDLCGVSGEIRIREYSFCDADLQITW